MNNNSHHHSGIVPEPPVPGDDGSGVEDVSRFENASFDDSGLETLLVDAYAAPPVPLDLLKRLDREIAAEWGESPRLAEGPLARVQRRVGGASAWLKAWPLAAISAALVMLTVLISTSTTTYAWSRMLDAVAERGVVEIETPTERRWLALEDGLSCRTTTGGSRLLNTREQTLLVRRRGANQAQRLTLDGSAPDRNAMFVRFLLGTSPRADRLTSLELVRERSAQTDDGSPLLHVTLRDNTGEEIELSLILDPETHLPRSVLTQNEQGQGLSASLDYPTEAVAELRKDAFPVDLATIDVERFDESLWAEPDSPLVANTDSPNPTDGEPTTTPDLNSELIAKTEPSVDVEPIAPEWFAAAPSKWQAVPDLRLSNNAVVEEVNTTLRDLWRERAITPVATATDAELLRRAYLDLAGRTPSVHEVRSYLQDTSEDRYERLVDRLLDSPDHASHLAAVWRSFLIPEGVDLSAFGGIQAFDKWLAEQFESEQGYDQLVRRLLLAEGRLSRSGPLLFYSAVKLNPDELASRTSRVFLGMRLECAQCHDHPFEPWKQEDFWGFAAFFAQISRPNAELETVSTVMRVHDVDHGEVKLPIFETIVPPKFLDENFPSETDLSSGGKSEEQTQPVARRQQLAKWLTGPDNPYFARATANRVWGHLFGTGIVDPIDDFGTQHPPKSSELLDLLAGHFIQTDFDLRELFRTIVLSDAYRLSSGAEDVNEERVEWFAQMNVKTLTAEQVYDCIAVATALQSAPVGGDYDFNLSRFGNSERDQFLQQFRTPVGRATEYQAGIPQALTLMNGSLIDGATGLVRSGLLKSLEAPFFTNQQRLEVLYLATLSRPPSAKERLFLSQYITSGTTGPQLQERLADVLWVLLNSAEFTMNH